MRLRALFTRYDHSRWPEQSVRVSPSKCDRETNRPLICTQPTSVRDSSKEVNLPGVSSFLQCFLDLAGSKRNHKLLEYKFHLSFMPIQKEIDQSPSQRIFAECLF